MTFLKEQIDWIHEKTHEGKTFSVGYDMSSISNNAYIDVLIKTSTNNPHLMCSLAMGGDALLEIYEDVTYSNIGTDLTTFNHNRTSNKTPTTTFYHTPTISSTGTRFNGLHFLPGGSGGHALGSINNGWAQEIILKSNSNYLVRATNISGQSQRGEVHILFYEPNL